MIGLQGHKLTDEPDSLPTSTPISDESTKLPISDESTDTPISNETQISDEEMPPLIDLEQKKIRFKVPLRVKKSTDQSTEESVNMRPNQDELRRRRLAFFGDKS